jgi:hypothetical protein
MQYLCKRPMIFWSTPILLLLGGCDGKPPECDSFETRNAVLQTVSSDHNNPLVRFAAGHSDEAASHDANPATTKPDQPPLYTLGEKMITRSTSDDKRTLKCSGALSATVGEAKATKEVNFTVQQASDGKITVSVEPFKF